MVSEGLETWVLLSSQEQLEKEHSAWLVNFDSTAWPTRWVAEDALASRHRDVDQPV